MDVTHTTFQAEVLDRSNEVPVLVDFWASWCAPCRSLGPVLEKVVEDLDGQVVLAKVDTDQNQELAGQFGIRSLPTVVLFKNGQLIDQFMGALPASKILDFLQPHLRVASTSERDHALALAKNGDVSGAIDLLETTLEQTPDNQDLLTDLAELCVQAQKFDTLSTVVARFPPSMRDEPQALRLRRIAGFSELTDTDLSSEELRISLASCPTKHQVRVSLMARDVLAGHYESALDSLIELLSIEKSFDDGAGARYLRYIFDILGPDDPRTRTYRSRMSALLH